MKVAYIKVSTPNQNLDRQKDEVIAAGAEQVFADVAMEQQTYVVYSFVANDLKNIINERIESKRTRSIHFKSKSRQSN